MPSNYIILSTTASSNANLLIAPTGLADAASYMRVYGASEFTIVPTEVISVLIAPHDDLITSLEASGYLTDKTATGDASRGIYIKRYTNETSLPQTLSDFHIFPIDRSFENVKYNLFWLQEHVDTVIFSSGVTGVYSYPHNLQPQELNITSEIINDNTKIKYTIYFPEVNNSGSTDYDTTNKPYLLNISYAYGNDTVSGTINNEPFAFSDTVSYSGLDAGIPTQGLNIEVPYYDQRPSWNNVPAQYVFRLNYNCADPYITGCIPFILPINHQLLSDTAVVDLDSWITTNLDESKLQKIDDIYIEREVIDRKRLSIGIKDISIPQKVYKKKGIYISNPYSSEYPIYTFSFKTNEFIPEYTNINKYDTVQYYVEFNSRPWVRISPINRDIEYDGINIVPKMYIFDINPEQSSECIKFLDYQVPVNIFRIKIIIDVTAVTDELFIPPEIRSYKCVIFDKNQLLEI